MPFNSTRACKFPASCDPGPIPWLTCHTKVSVSSLQKLRDWKISQVVILHCCMGENNHKLLNSSLPVPVWTLRVLDRVYSYIDTEYKVYRRHLPACRVSPESKRITRTHVIGMYWNTAGKGIVTIDLIHTLHITKRSVEGFGFGLNQLVIFWD